MAAINFSSKFTLVPAVGYGIDIWHQNQSTVILYVNYKVKGTETGLKLSFKTRNPSVSLTDYYTLEERNPATEIVDIVYVKVQDTGLLTIPVPIPIRSDFCIVDAVWDGVPDATSLAEIDVDLDTLKYV